MSSPLLSRWRFASLRRITTSSHRYIAEIDGLRFIAIFSVLLFHVWYVSNHVAGAPLIDSPFNFLLYPLINGHRGVHIFFGVSGFILGLPFAAQWLANAPPVKLGRFYVRRVTRLEPPYLLALLLFYGAAAAMHNDDSTQPGFISGLLLRIAYAHNLVRDVRASLNGVTWTLEIEVQFYLLAPLLAQVFRLATLSRRALLMAAIGGAPFLAPYTWRPDMTILGYLQYFLIGFLVADLYAVRAVTGRWPEWRYDALGIGALLAILFWPETPLFFHLFPWAIGVLAIGALRGNRFTAVLRRPAIATLGGMCYSLYLLHYPLLSFIANKVVHAGMTVPAAYVRLGAVGLPIVIGSGIAYYILIERPCMNPNWPGRVGRLFRQDPRPHA